MVAHSINHHQLSLITTQFLRLYLISFVSLAKSQKEITKVCVMKQKVDLLGSVMPEVTIQNMFSNYKSRECHTCMGR